jgi:CheY-like chemotaxis protein
MNSSSGKRESDPPADFIELVRDGLLHIYDLTYLQSHPLLEAGPSVKDGSRAGGRILRQTLLDAVEVLRPGPGVAASSRPWRLYRILEQRYIEGRPVADTAAIVALSRAQYHREHHRSLYEVAVVLWERWQLAGRWVAPDDDAFAGTLSPLESTRIQEDSLVSSDAGERIDLDETLRGVCEILQPLCSRHGTVLHLDREGRLSPIRGDRSTLRHAILSVLAHAIGVTHGATLDVSVRMRLSSVEIEVSGRTGELPDPESLGLVESRPFVEALNGQQSIRTLSQDAGRWAVDLCFPASDRPTLAIVDNSADFIRLVERYLVGHAWEVIGISDASHFSGLIHQYRPDVILLDVVIPGRDGWDLLLELKSNPSTRDIPVIICSVLHEPEVAISLGAMSYLQKPIDQRQLIEAITPLQSNSMIPARNDLDRSSS